VVVEEEKEEKGRKRRRRSRRREKPKKVQRYKPDLEFDTGDRRHKGDQVDE